MIHVTWDHLLWMVAFVVTIGFVPALALLWFFDWLDQREKGGNP